MVSSKHSLHSTSSPYSYHYVLCSIIISITDIIIND